MRIRKNTLKSVLMMIFISVFMSSLASAQSRNEMKSSSKTNGLNANVLNNLDFRGKMGTYGEENGNDEEIFFENGMFHSVLCDNYGIKPSKYTIRQGGDPDIILFYTEAANDKGDRILWHGKIMMDRTGLTKRHKIEAYATFMPVGEKSILLWMNGEASKQSMEHSGKNSPRNVQTASKDDNY